MKKHLIRMMLVGAIVATMVLVLAVPGIAMAQYGPTPTPTPTPDSGVAGTTDTPGTSSGSGTSTSSSTPSTGAPLIIAGAVGAAMAGAGLMLRRKGK